MARHKEETRLVDRELLAEIRNLLLLYELRLRQLVALLQGAAEVEEEAQDRRPS